MSTKRKPRPGEAYTLEYVDGLLAAVAILYSAHDAAGVLRAAERRLRRFKRRQPRSAWGAEYYNLLNARDAADVALRVVNRAPRRATDAPVQS